MRIWARYAVLATFIAAAGVGIAGLLAPAHRPELVFAGATALAIQALAFAALVPARGRPTLVLAAWSGGTLLRLGAVVVTALWLVDGGPFDAKATLLALVPLLTVLALLEPTALRPADEPNRLKGQ